MPRLLPLLAVTLATACYKDDGPSLGQSSPDTASDGVFGDCDPAVYVPVGLLQDDGPVEATAHRETYGAAPEPYAVRLGWPSSDPSQSVSMLWRTDVDTLASEVLIGPADTFPDGATRIEGSSFLFGGPTGVVGEGDYRIHETRLCGLVEPATTYTYRVGGDGGWSEAFTFTTPGSPGSFDTFRVAFAGDSRGAYSTWENMLAAIDATEPDLIVFSGDMVEFGSVQSEWDSWFAAGGDVIAQRPLLPAHGNHEFLAQHYFAQFGLPNNEQWYTYELGSLLLVSLNDTAAPGAIEEQAAWLGTVLNESEATWKVANHHQPPYSTSDNHGSQMDLRAAWTPVYETHGVDLVVNGHNHLYERSVPILGDEARSDGDGVVYMVSGGAGAPLYTGVEEQWFNATYEAVEHFVVGDFGPTGASFVARDLDGNVIDEFEIPKG